MHDRRATNNRNKTIVTIIAVPIVELCRFIERSFSEAGFQARRAARLRRDDPIAVTSGIVHLFCFCRHQCLSSLTNLYIHTFVSLFHEGQTKSTVTIQPTRSHSFFRSFFFLSSFFFDNLCVSLVHGMNRGRRGIYFRA